MEAIVQLLTQPWMTYVFVSIILLVALRPLYQTFVNISAASREMDEATRILADLGKNRQEEFYNQFQNVSQQISKISGLRQPWREFVESMHFDAAAGNAQNKRAYFSRRPNEYFNRDTLLSPRLNLQQFFAYPNYLIGIGLTFTFIGLAAALHVAQSGLTSGAGQQALKDLLAVASIKFISSIFGIVSSLLVSALQRARMSAFEQKVDTFCMWLEACAQYASTEKLLHEGLREQRQQTLLLNDLARNIALGINDVLATQLSGSVANALEPLSQEIRGLATRFTEGSEAALRSILDHFLQELRKGSLQELEGLAQNISVLKVSLEGLATHMESAGKRLTADSHASAAQLAEMLAQFNASFSPIQQSIGQFSQSLAALQGTAGQIAQAGSQIQHAATDNKESLQEFGRSVSALSASLAPIRELTGSLSQSLSRMESSAMNLQSAGGTIAGAAEGFKHTAATIERVEGQWNQKVQSLSALADNVTVALTGAANGLRHSASLIERSESQLAQKTQLFESLAERIAAAIARVEQMLGRNADAQEAATPKRKSRWGK